jgi:hypothetical protein
MRSIIYIGSKKASSAPHGAERSPEPIVVQGKLRNSLLMYTKPTDGALAKSHKTRYPINFIYLKTFPADNGREKEKMEKHPCENPQRCCKTERIYFRTNRASK